MSRRLDEFEDNMVGLINKIPTDLDKIRRLSGVQKVLRTSPDSSNDVEEVQIDSKASSSLQLSGSPVPQEEVQRLVQQAYRRGLEKGSQ